MNKYVYAALFFISATLVYGQEELSLNEAIKRGLEKNYDIQIEAKNIEVAETNNSWGEAGLFPSLSVALNGSYNTNDNIKVFSPFQPTGKTVSTGYNPNANLNWSLLNINNIIISKHRLEKLQEESSGNADIVIANNIQAIILGYYVAVLEKRRTDEFQKQLKLSKDKFDLVKIKSDLGSAVTTDLLLEEGNYLTDSSNFVTQRLNYLNAISNLNFLIGEPDPTKEYSLTDDLVFDYEELVYEDLVQQLEDSNIDLRKQYLTQSVLNYDVNLRKGDRYPQLTLGATYNYNSTKVDVSDLPVDFRTDRVTQEVFESRNTASANYGANFSLSFNLFNGGKVNRAIQRSIIAEDIGNIRIERLKASLNRDLKQALDRYKVRKQLYDISEMRLRAAQQNLLISEEKYKNGTISSFDYRTVQNNNLSASIQKLQALYNLIDSQVSILRLTGGIIKTYN